MAIVAILFVLAGGLAYALTEVVKDVPAKLILQFKVPDGIEVYSDAGLSRAIDLLDFGQADADVFGTLNMTPIDLWVKNRSNSVVELRVEDDFRLAQVMFGFEGGEPDASLPQDITLEPEQVLKGQVTLRLLERQAGRHDFTVSFITTSPQGSLGTPTVTPEPACLPGPNRDSVPSLEHQGSVIATSHDANNVSALQILLTNPEGPDPVSFSATGTLLTYMDANARESIRGDQAGAIVTRWTRVWLIGQGSVVDQGEIVKIMVNLTAGTLLSNTQFTVEIITCDGAVVRIERTTPFEITTIMDLG